MLKRKNTTGCRENAFPAGARGKCSPVITIALLLFMIAIAAPASLAGEDRIPRPEFKSDYQTPGITTPQPRNILFDYLDVIVLFLLLSLASYLALKKRSRNGMLACAVFSVLYFGFWRKGCICAVGSLQNVCLALTDPAYTIPLTVILFFILPLLFTLLFGRTFCAAVCPLGAIQELVALRPKQIPAWLNKTLRIVPLIYLCLTLLYALTGTEFLICRFDPFVGFFRFGAWFEMVIFGTAMLIIGVFVARPYCRFLCPYGVLLGWMSYLSGQHVAITPDKCIQCRLCEKSCPVEAITAPSLPEGESEDKRRGMRRIGRLLILLPVLAVGMGFLLFTLAPLLSRVHPTVQTALQVAREEAGKAGQTTLESDTFRAAGKTIVQLYAEADAVIRSFRFWGWILGAGLGILAGIRLIGFSTWKKQEDFLPDKISCVSCCRCFASCPREHLRIRKLKVRP